MTTLAGEPEVTVAIVSWNTRDLLRECLESLHADVESGRAEVWVVDNGSSDGSPALVQDQFAWARLVQPEANLGFGRAVNLVARQTRSRWVAPSNADIALQPGALSALLAAGARHPEAGSIAPRLVLPDGSTQHSVFPFPSPRLSLAEQLGMPLLFRGLGERLCLPGRWDPGQAREVPWAVAAFLLVRRRAWEEAGGFDETQWMYAEDLDLGWRLARAGWRCRYEPAAEVRHAESAAANQVLGAEKPLRWMEATYRWMERRHGLRATWATAAIGWTGMALRWLLGALLARLGRTQGAALRSRATFWMRMHRTGLRSRRALTGPDGAELTVVAPVRPAPLPRRRSPPCARGRRRSARRRPRTRRPRGRPG